MGGLFKRINFFKGLFMDAKDWENEQLFHREKQRFHNKYLHRPGVVFDCLEGLKVTMSSSGTHLVIHPGYAIDGEGRDLFIPEAIEFEVPPLQSFDPPTTIYIAISYKEVEDQLRNNDANPEYSGYAYIVEDTVVTVNRETPDNIERLELARVNLSKNATYIRDANGSGKTKSKSRKSDREVLPSEGVDNASGTLSETRNSQNIALSHTVSASTFPSQEDEIDMSQVIHAGARTASIQKELGLLNFADKLMDTTIQVRAGVRKQDETNVLIEKLDIKKPPSMYMIQVHSLEGARTQWWLECNTDEKYAEYTLHIRNESSKPTQVLCRVFKMRI